MWRDGDGGHNRKHSDAWNAAQRSKEGRHGSWVWTSFSLDLSFVMALHVWRLSQAGEAGLTVDELTRREVGQSFARRRHELILPLDEHDETRR